MWPLEEHPYNMAVDVAALIPTILIKSLLFIALSRHPRDKYFIATKLSNFSPDTWSREASLRMLLNYHST